MSFASTSGAKVFSVYGQGRQGPNLSRKTRVLPSPCAMAGAPLPLTGRPYQERREDEERRQWDLEPKWQRSHCYPPAHPVMHMECYLYMLCNSITFLMCIS